MINYLVAHFVPDHNDIKNPAVRASYGVLSSATGIICNVFLFAMKFLVGNTLHSISVISDAFNNLSDAASSLVSLVGVKLAQRPADKEHPYGHGRMEYITAFIVAFLVLEVGWTFFKSSFEKIRNPQELALYPGALLLLLLSVGVKLWLAYFNRTLGRKIHSQIMEATAADALGDVLATSATILSLVLYTVWGINIDGWIGILVSLAVLYAGIGIVKDTLEPLIGEGAAPEEMEEILNLVNSHEGILGSHDLMVHHYGPSRRIASIHVEMDNRQSMETVHKVIDHIEREAMSRLGISMVIHIDPVETTDPGILDLRRRIKCLIDRKNPLASMHDFQCSREEGQEEISFDIVLPYEVKEPESEKFVRELKEEILKERPAAVIEITVDRGSR